MGYRRMRTSTVVFGVLAIAAAIAVADELKDLSSVDVPVAQTETAPAAESKADLGEGVGWGGALMTSGSFTMMASGGDLEEELGEGVGWGGSLMTSGSFTMMASG